MEKEPFFPFFFLIFQFFPLSLRPSLISLRLLLQVMHNHMDLNHILSQEETFTFFGFPTM